MLIETPENPELYLNEKSGFKIVENELRYFSEGQKKAKRIFCCQSNTHC